MGARVGAWVLVVRCVRGCWCRESGRVARSLWPIITMMTKLVMIGREVYDFETVV